MNKFKAGDKVYHPLVSQDIRILTKLPGQSENLLVAKEDEDNIYIFDEYGCEYRELHRYKSIFHATEENYELLSKLYGIEFEKPKPKPTPRQVIENKLQTAKFVTCLVGDRYDWDGMALIVSVKDGNDGAIEYIDGMGNAWYDAQLIDDSGCEIWE